MNQKCEISGLVWKFAQFVKQQTILNSAAQKPYFAPQAILRYDFLQIKGPSGWYSPSGTTWCMDWDSNSWNVGSRYAYLVQNADQMVLKLGCWTKDFTRLIFSYTRGSLRHCWQGLSLILADICLCERSAHCTGPGEQRHRVWDGGLTEGCQSGQKTWYVMCRNHSAVPHLQQHKCKD